MKTWLLLVNVIALIGTTWIAYAQSGQDTFLSDADYLELRLFPESLNDDHTLYAYRFMRHWLDQWQPQNKTLATSKYFVEQIAIRYNPYPACHNDIPNDQNPAFRSMWE